MNDIRWPVGVNNSAAQIYATLDRGHKGYQETTMSPRTPNLAGRFEQCDRNHEGRLTRDEVDSCLKPMPAGKQ